MKLCHTEEIVHKLIPPGEKELQGLVEPSHRQDDQELFSRIEPHDIDEFNQLLKEFYLHRNEKRRFKKLGWRSANTWLKDYDEEKKMKFKKDNKNVDKLVA